MQIDAYLGNDMIIGKKKRMSTIELGDDGNVRLPRKNGLFVTKSVKTKENKPISSYCEK